MFIRQFHIVQCLTTGEFLSLSNDNHGIYTQLLSRATHFYNLSHAIDTAQNELVDDFQITTFYEKLNDHLPHEGGAAEYLQAAPPLGNTGGKDNKVIGGTHELV